MQIDKKLTHLDPGKIKKNPENPRLIFREEDLDILLRSIDQVGIQVPLSVYKKKNTNIYLLIDGERRWRCALKLGLKNVPVIVEPQPSPLENLLMMFNIHNVRVQWDLMALAVKIERVKDLIFKEQKLELTKGELADLTGVSTVTITRCEELLSLPKKYKDLIWRELEKPKGEQKFTEDLFIEINKCIRTIENYLPEVIDQYSSRKLLDNFFNKYKQGVVTNRVAFRDISRIARGEKVGISKEKVISVLLDFINDPEYSIEKAYEATVADAYLERDYERKILDVINLIGDLDVSSIEKETYMLLSKLKKQLDKIFEEI